MTTTAAALRTGRYHRLAYVLVFEGVGLAFTTTNDVAGISAAWSGSDWQTATGGKGAPDTTASWYTGLFLPGEFKQEIEILAPKVQPATISFRVLDPLGTLAQMVSGASRATAWCHLTADLAPNVNPLVTTDTASFSALGAAYLLYVGNETIRVSEVNRTSNGWSTSTRGVYSLYSTTTGTRFRRYHRVNKVNGLQPRVSNTPYTWFNRGVALYLHHYEEGVGWNDDSEALLVWSGRLKSVDDNGDKSFTFGAMSLTEVLSTQVMEDQYVAKVAPGRYITEEMARVYIREYGPGLTTTEYYATLATYNTVVSAGQIATDLDTLLRESVSGLKFGWGVARTNSNTFKIQFTTKHTSYVRGGAPQQFVGEIGLDDRVWKLLGFPISGGRYFVKEAQGKRYIFTAKTLMYKGTDGSLDKWEIIAEKPPVLYDFTRHAGITQKIRLEASRGAWKVQPYFTLAESVSSLTEGYLQIGDLAVLQGYFSGSDFVITADLTGFFSTLGFNGKGGVTEGPGEIREGEQGELEAVQIWYERAPVRDLLMRLLLSTGASGWNDSTFDKNPAGMGIELPASLLDKDSARELGGGDIFTLALNKPTECSRIIESICATYGRHIVYRQGQICLVEPKSDGPTIAAAWALTESNKATPGEPMRSSQNADGIVNRLEMKFDRSMDGSFRKTANVEDMVSSSNFGQRRAASVEAWGLESGGSGWERVIAQAAAKALAYFSQPMTIAERSIDKTLIQIAPGDTVLLTDNYLVDPRTGTRGVTSFPAWVLGVSFDYARMQGRVRLAYNAALDTAKICAWAPTVRVDNTAANEGYIVVDASNRYLACLPYQYDATGESVGVERFSAGDVLWVRELSPVDPFVPTVFQVTVASVDTTPAAPKIYLTAVITGWTLGKKYIVTPASISLVQQAQKRDTFIADDADNSTGAAALDAYLWGALRPVGSTAAPSLQTKWVRPPRGSSGKYLYRKGDPLAVGDMFEAMLSLNSLIAYRTRNQATVGMWTHGAGVTTTTAREVIYGPVWVPCYGWGKRTLKVKLFARSTAGSTATVYISTSNYLPQGLTNFTVLFTDGVSGLASFTFNNSGYAWQLEQAVAAYPDPGGSMGMGPPGVWVTIEGVVASGAVNLQGVSIVEGEGN